MVCPYCAKATKVSNSRPQRRSNQVWRRRQCLSCRAVFTSLEALDLATALSVRQGGSLKPFLSDYLFTDVLVALSHRKNRYIEARELTGTIVQRLLSSASSPAFSSTEIAEITAGVLKRFDKRAWHRYVAEHNVN